jgi:hypothetical protein
MLVLINNTTTTPTQHTRAYSTVVRTSGWSSAAAALHVSSRTKHAHCRSLLTAGMPAAELQV